MFSYENEEDGKSEVGFYVKVILAQIAFVALVIAGLSYFGVISLFGTAERAPADASVPDGNHPATRKVSAENMEPARAAIDALGEINSVASVGATYLQFTNALQSSKVKYDAAMRRYRPATDADIAVQRELDETLKIYVDAKSAWEEFNELGGEFDPGYLIPRNYAMEVERMSKVYGYKSHHSKGYYQEDVLGSILQAADKKFDSVSASIMGRN